MDTGSTDPRTSLRRLYEACPLCESTSFGKFREENCTRHGCYDPALPPTMNWCLCQDCGHCFVDGYLTDEGLAILFRRTHDIQSPAHMFRAPEQGWLPGQFPIEAQRGVWAVIVERVTRLRGRLPRAGDRWIDVGCGNGMLLFTAWEWGYHPVGLDMREETVATLRNMAIEAHRKDFMELETGPGEVAVISMANVLEHMPFPKPALRRAHEMLQPDGMIFLSVPNGDTIIWKYLDAYGCNPYWYEIEHCHNFTRTRLFALLEETGFEPVSYDINQRYRTGMEVVARKQG